MYHLCILALYYLCQLLQKYSIATTAQLRSLKWSILKTPLLLMWYWMDWLRYGFWTRTGGWEFLLLRGHWHIISMPLKAGGGIRAETSGMDGVFPPDDLGSGPCTPFLIYIPYIIRLSIFSQLSIIQYVGLCVFNLPIHFAMIERIDILWLIIIMKSEVWTITHYLGLGHETMVCAVCLSLFL